jgi:isopentenyl diphosphate isomerase/L-lactate dehydrogenase-like FMN-dependent dehydrogenase
VGRPYVYGLALEGEDGVREVLRNLAADFDLALGLSGCASIAEAREAQLVYDDGGSAPQAMIGT